MEASGASREIARRPFWIRVIHTPLGDLIRLRVTGRFDVKGLLADSGLPHPIQKTLLEVTLRTGLWRSERIEVARELVGRFSDGLAAGETPERLLEELGTPKQAARRIRRARLRARPLAWRVSVRVLQAAVCMVAVSVVLFVLLWARYIWGRPTVSWNYLAEYNAEAMGVPEEQRAWPLYRAAMLKLKPIPEGLTVVDDRGYASPSEDPEAAEEPERRRPIRPNEFVCTTPGEEHWDALVRYLGDSEEAIDLIRQAAARPRLGFYYRDPADGVVCPSGIMDSGKEAIIPPVAEDNPRVLDLDLTHLHRLRELARLLRADALRAAEAHDGAAVTADLTAMLGTSDLCRDGERFIVADLVAMSILHMTCDTLGEILADRPESLSHQQLAEVAQRLAAAGHGRPFRVSLEGERALLRDMWQRIYTDNGRGDGYLTAESFDLYAHIQCRLSLEPWQERVDSPALLLLPVLAAGRREIAEFADRIMDEAERECARPLWEHEEEPMNARLNEVTESWINVVRYSPALLTLPPFGMANRAGERATQRRDAALVVIALERYRRRAGHWPERLDQLVPDLLPVVPPDRFDGKPLKYRVVDGRPVVYSIGVDRCDDGGVPPEAPYAHPDFWRPPSQVAEIRAEGTDCGDWVLWPPVEQHLR